VNFKLNGIFSSKDTQNRIWWAKLATALVISNIFFFMIFSKNETAESHIQNPVSGMVEVQLRAELLTPFQSGKRVLLMQREARILLPAVLKGDVDPEGKITLEVTEKVAAPLFKFTSWEILPFVADFKIDQGRTYEGHEILY
jgi:hypothetical protein